MIIEKPERRARNVALAGLVFQVLLSVFLIVLWSYSQSQSVLAVARLSMAGILIWVALLLVYHQRKLVQDEDFETEQLRRERASLGGEALFDTEGERLLLARRRLHWMYRWILPIFTVIIFGALLASGLLGWSWGFRESFRSQNWPEVVNVQNGLLIAFIGGAAFLSFLLSRYVVGMARHAEWKMLRAGSSYLMGTTLSLVATAAVLAVRVVSGNPVPEHVLAFVLRILMLVLAAEFALNFVLDFYRPRSPGEEPRPSFDSRFLGLFSEPGGIARSIADAVNYQFGFDVSSTWFYQLLQRSVVPLIAFAVLTLFAASCLVFVGTGEEAVIEHFGEPKHVKMVNGEPKVQTVGPGLHLKWPWPIDVAHKVAVNQIHELKVGVVEAGAGESEKEELILWTNKHSREPHLVVLLATPELVEHINRNEKESETQPAADAGPAVAAADESAETQPAERREAKAVPVSILRVAGTIQYKIQDAWAWLTRYEEPQKMLEAIANREIVRHCASANVMGLMGSDRSRIERAIWDSIQESSDRVGLGVEIKFFGLQGVHPPQDLAEDFQKVIGAEHEKIASINSAWADANKKLTEAAGDVRKARALVEAIATMNFLEHSPTALEAEREAARDKVRVLFFGNADEQIRPIGGQAAVRLAAARSRRWQLENEAAAQATEFEQDIATMRAAPNVFKMRKYLETLASSMENARKYIIASQGRYELPMFQLNLQDPVNAPLDTALETSKP